MGDVTHGLAVDGVDFRQGDGSSVPSAPRKVRGCGQTAGRAHASDEAPAKPAHDIVNLKRDDALSGVRICIIMAKQFRL